MDVKWKKFDREAVREARDDLQRAVVDFEGSHGVEVKIGNAKFTDNNMVFVLEVALKDADGTAISKEAEDFKFHACRLGFKASDLGREFVSWNGKRFVVQGLARKNRKYPILAKCLDDGRTYKMTSEQVLKGFEVGAQSV